eukprot:CAMPEP_0170070262 /NCGR_PEP_ID=MMETSP0019_2-20121128/8623_1 /TAXON_ID=98059 /ORGANISM="Dinobryon sp., Strain UTEXLB2267" /LENGTH=573 /DNA_ID=CAMNT_0010278503 /DNA_START=66 /DNA_END=1787 /DNA_ORIENTATION=+
MISDGSELLLLVPSLASIVGSLVLPVLGAFPDGCIVFFSGMGPNAQEQLNIGVGALAGSTVLLLTIPWSLCIFGGRVDFDEDTGKPSYKHPKHTTEIKLGNTFVSSCTNSGILLNNTVNVGSYIVMATSLIYLLLQLPGLKYLHSSMDQQADGERIWAIISFIVCVASLVGYLMYQLKLSSLPENPISLAREEYIIESIALGKVTLLGVMAEEFERTNPIKSIGEASRILPSPIDFGSTLDSSELYQAIPLQQPRNVNARQLMRRSSSEKLEILPSNETIERLRRLLKPFFRRYDVDNSGSLSVQELFAVFHDMGEQIPFSEFSTVFESFDEDGSGLIEYEEFVRGTTNYLWRHSHILEQQKQNQSDKTTETDNDEILRVLKTAKEHHIHHEEDEEHEEDELPEDIRSLSPQEQQRRIKWRAFSKMAIGSVVLLIFSEPTIDVISEMGTRTGIGSFYIAFVLAPLISNASELIATYNYACRKTEKSIAISLTALQGAAVMNNTLVLGIFMLLIWTQHLAWEFLSETLTILFVQIAAALLALKRSQTLTDALMYLALYPFALMLKASLEALGWD